jgi:hypothetical protein
VPQRHLKAADARQISDRSGANSEPIDGHVAAVLTLATLPETLSTTRVPWRQG